MSMDTNHIHIPAAIAELPAEFVAEWRAHGLDDEDIENIADEFMAKLERRNVVGKLLAQIKGGARG